MLGLTALQIVHYGGVVMQRVAFFIIVLVLGFSAAANATVIYDMAGNYPTADPANSAHFAYWFTGVIGFEGIDNIFDIQQGQTYQWFYNISYMNMDRAVIGASLYYGSANVGFMHDPQIQHSDSLLTTLFFFNLVGDNGATLNRPNPDMVWFEPNPIIDGVSWQSSVGGYVTAFDQIDVAQVPEPSTLLLVGCSLFGVAVFRRIS